MLLIVDACKSILFRYPGQFTLIRLTLLRSYTLEYTLMLMLVGVAMVDDAAKANEWLSASALFIMQAQYTLGT